MLRSLIVLAVTTGGLAISAATGDAHGAEPPTAPSTDSDVLSTHADVFSTHADVFSTHADVFSTWAATAAAVPGGVIVTPLPADTNHFSLDGYELFFAPIASAGASAPTAPTTTATAAGVPAEPVAVVGMIGLGLNAKARPIKAVSSGRFGSHSIDVQVGTRDYPIQRLTISNKRMVNPLRSDLSRIAKERKIIRAALAQHTDSAAAFTGLQKPVEGPYSSPFGTRRILNGQPRNRHTGVDIAAPTGAPIVAPAAGTVLNTGGYFYNGNTVFLDHGRGLITMYCHLSETLVEPGQQVLAGQQIGKVGMTGRVTGPHLHWSAVLNNNAIDPRMLMAEAAE